MPSLPAPRLAGVVLALGLSAAVAGCAVAPPVTAPSAPKTSSSPGTSSAPLSVAVGYPVSSGPDVIFHFPLNENVFEGTVTAVLPAVRVTDELAEGEILEAVYTPVRVRITAVYQGALVPGREVVVRAMGGAADGAQYQPEVAPDVGVFSVGDTFAVFGGQYASVTGEREPAIMPTFLYELLGGTFVDETSPGGDPTGAGRARVPADEFRLRLEGLRSADQG